MEVTISLNALALLLSFKAEREDHKELTDGLDFMREYDDTPMKHDMILRAAEQLGVDLGR